jgi:ubiquinone/menaquinone biosynthesis C-methylase UbiE
MSDYDVNRRAESICSGIPENFNGVALEIGCGTGAISKSLRLMIENLVVSDISEVLARETANALGCDWFQEDATNLSFPDASYDLVVSSECIEHTPNPSKCVVEMLRVLRPEGILIVTTPNKLWWPVVRLSQITRIRKFQGNEKFLSVRQLSSIINDNGGVVLQRTGCHLFPWHFPFVKPVLRRIDKYAGRLHPLMINQIAIARKVPVRN